jgi:hypothetical protein
MFKIKLPEPGIFFVKGFANKFRPSFRGTGKTIQKYLPIKTGYPDPDKKHRDGSQK